MLSVFFYGKCKLSIFHQKKYLSWSFFYRYGVFVKWIVTYFITRRHLFCYFFKVFFYQIFNKWPKWKNSLTTTTSSIEAKAKYVGNFRVKMLKKIGCVCWGYADFVTGFKNNCRTFLIWFNHLSVNPTKWSNTVVSRRIIWVCVTILWGWRLKG